MKIHIAKGKGHTLDISTLEGRFFRWDTFLFLISFSTSLSLFFLFTFDLWLYHHFMTCREQLKWVSLVSYWVYIARLNRIKTNSPNLDVTILSTASCSVLGLGVVQSQCSLIIS